MSEITGILNRFSAELTGSILDLMEEAGVPEKVCNKVKQNILDKRDSTLFRINKFGAQDYGKLYKNIR